MIRAVIRAVIRALVLALAAASPVLAQDAPAQPPNPHFRVLDYVENQVIPLQVAPGYQLTIEFGGGERIENVALGDATAWQATPNKRGDHLFVKALGGSATNMTVVTDMRLYAFELVPAGSPDQMVYALRFRYAPATTAALPAPGAMAGRYRLSGAHAIRPSALSDDGVHTFMQWPPSVTMPAIYTIGADGREAIANGAMRDGTYVVDGVFARLVFRRDNYVSRATRSRERR